jgi:uncharacterized alpha-E superfamily protein
MLSRAATALSFIGRHIERADHLARILDVHVALSLDHPTEVGSGFWSGFMGLAGWPNSSVDDPRAAIECIVTGDGGPSILRSVTAARTAAQSVRPSLPTELYEQLNTLYWRAQDKDWEQELHSFLARVQMSVRVVDGLVEDAMLHDQARDFTRLGRYLERASSVVSLALHKSAELAEAGEEALDWTAALKCCFAFESYRLRVSGPVTREGVVEFLLFERTLPRSAWFAVMEALAAVRRIDEGGPRTAPHRALNRLNTMFETADSAAVAANPVAFAREFDELMIRLAGTLRETYFGPNRVAAGPGDTEGGRRMPQQ